MASNIASNQGRAQTFWRYAGEEEGGHGCTDPAQHYEPPPAHMTQTRARAVCGRRLTSKLFSRTLNYCCVIVDMFDEPVTVTVAEFPSLS